MRLLGLSLLALCLTSLCGAQNDLRSLGQGTDSNEAGYMEQEYGFTRDNLNDHLKYVLESAQGNTNLSIDRSSFSSLPNPNVPLGDMADGVEDGGTLYVPSGYYSLDQTLYINKNLTLIGEGLVVLGAENDRQILDIEGDLTLHIENITFINGRGDYGGAIYAKAKELALEKCDFYRNAAYQGAVLYSDGGNISFNKCKIIGNVAISGMVALSYGGRLVLENTEFGDNVAGLASNSLFFIDHSSQQGASRDQLNQSDFHQNALGILEDYAKGIYSNDLDLVINNCSFHDNAAEGSGETSSDIVAVGNVLVANSDFRSNTGDNYGGAISIGGDLVVITNTSVINNTINVWGPSAGIKIYGGNALVHCCSVSGNHNTTSGIAERGGIYVNRDANVEIIDSIITGNSGHTGGMHIKPSATVSIENCNISGNSASYKGGGVYNEGALIFKGGCVTENIPDNIYSPTP